MKVRFLGGWSLGLLFAFAGTNALAVVQSVDTKASKIVWIGKKLAGQHTGTVLLKEGTVDIADTPAPAAKDAKGKPTTNPTTASTLTVKSGSFTLDMTSIDDEDLKSNQEYHTKLVTHLKSPDFFDVKKWPTGKFTLVSATPNKAKPGEFTVKGNLTIRDKTNPVEFPATITADGKVYRAKGTFTINRLLWDIKYNSKKFFDPVKLGDKLIYDDIELSLDLVTSALPGKA